MRQPHENDRSIGAGKQVQRHQAFRAYWPLRRDGCDGVGGSHQHGDRNSPILRQMTKLTDEQVLTALASLPGWSLKDGALHCEYSFADFVDADAFLTRASKAVPRWDQQPKAFQNWHRVIVNLKTEEAGGVTLQDVEVAGVLESLSQRVP